MLYDFQPKPPAADQVGPPDELAHRGNRTATSWRHSRRSRVALRRRIDRMQCQPEYQKLVHGATDAVRMWWIAFTVAHVVLVYVDWHLSKALYDAFLHDRALLLYGVVEIMILTLSMFIGELTPWGILQQRRREQTEPAESEVDALTKQLYHQAKTPRKPKGRNLAPWIAVAAAFVLLGVLAYGSYERVLLQAEVNRDLVSSAIEQLSYFDVFLIPALHGLNIVFGIGAVALGLYLYFLARLRYFHREHVRYVNMEDRFAQAAVECWAGYLQRLTEFNRHRHSQNLPDHPMIPQSRDMALLWDRFHAGTGENPPESAADPIPDAPDETPPGANGVHRDLDEDAGSDDTYNNEEF